MMRTTVVLEDEVWERLHEESRVREASFRLTLNEVIRDGLALAEQRRSTTVPFRVKPRTMGLKPGFSYDSISKLIELGEGEEKR